MLKDLQTKLDEFEQSTVVTQEQNQELNNEMINEVPSIPILECSKTIAQDSIKKKDEYTEKLDKKRLYNKQLLQKKEKEKRKI